MVPLLSTTLIVKSKVPAADGVPVIAPVVVFRLKPAGREPAETEKVYGETPPLTATDEV